MFSRPSFARIQSHTRENQREDHEAEIRRQCFWCFWILPQLAANIYKSRKANSFSCAQVKNAEEKLRRLHDGAVLVDPKEREKIQGTCVTRVAQWRKRKKAFKELWDMITESLPKDLKEFKVDYLNSRR